MREHLKACLDGKLDQGQLEDGALVYVMGAAQFAVQVCDLLLDLI